MIAESRNITYGAVTRIPRWALATPREYHARFEIHLNAGHAWINMNAVGIWEETLLVVIELPGYINTIPRSGVSVNFSGFSMQKGDASRGIEIVDYSGSQRSCTMTFQK